MELYILKDGKPISDIPRQPSFALINAKTTIHDFVEIAIDEAIEDGEIEEEDRNNLIIKIRP